MQVKQPKPPSALGAEGRALWRQIIADAASQGVELESRELIWLREAGKLADMIVRLEDAVADAPMIVPGYNKQPTANPLLAELRMHRQLLGQTIARIQVSVPEEPVSAAGAPNRFRSAANVRWGGA